jgi:hypothetical protein
MQQNFKIYDFHKGKEFFTACTWKLSEKGNNNENKRNLF